ncbi:MAG TPA: hypothetical protein EYH17_00510 [Pyrodictium sp.]|nr:hypothetical protein [Pyrodictium sp.]
MRWWFAVGFVPAILLLLALVASVMVVQGYSKLIPCGNGVYLLVEDNGYVTVYAMLGVDESKAIRIALECLEMIENSPLAHEMPLTLEPISAPMQGVKWRVEEVGEIVMGVSSQTTVQKMSKWEKATTIASTPHSLEYSVSPTISMLLVILCVLLGYFLSKLVIGRILSGQ